MDQGHKPDEFVSLEQLHRYDAMLERLIASSTLKGLASQSVITCQHPNRSAALRVAHVKRHPSTRPDPEDAHGNRLRICRPERIYAVPCDGAG
ncbi:hypothetical protein DEM27_19230 [Metarhizobium album]|uniref:Uncharacterized protein n=1 Tax=Metarhizobium album TaxID=2182425 RepID=A0A2U2DMX1_9HYPH|nr:hypothetical protein DEM27_19230 [Rhizobium album]